MKNYVYVQVYGLWCISQEEGRTQDLLCMPAEVAARLLAAKFLYFREKTGYVCAEDGLEDMLLAVPEAFIVRGGRRTA